MIKSWIKGIVESSPESPKKNVKMQQQALEDAFKDAKSNKIDISNVCNGGKNIGSKADEFDLIELLFRCDGCWWRADKEELNQISKITDSWVNCDEINKMKDKGLLNLIQMLHLTHQLKKRLELTLHGARED